MLKVYNLKKYKGLRKNLRKTMTEEEVILWSYLKNKQMGYKFRRQVSIGRYIVDFYCPTRKLVIELDGSQHAIERNGYDKQRTQYLESKGIKVIRYWNDEIRYNLNGVCEDIKGHLN